MKNEPSASLRQVWAMKQAAEEETRPCATAEQYFRHIRSRLPDLRLPEAARAPRPAGPAQAGTKRRDPADEYGVSPRAI